MLIREKAVRFLSPLLSFLTVFLQNMAVVTGQDGKSDTTQEEDLRKEVEAFSHNRATSRKPGKILPSLTKGRVGLEKFQLKCLFRLHFAARSSLTIENSEVLSLAHYICVVLRQLPLRPTAICRVSCSSFPAFRLCHVICKRAIMSYPRIQLQRGRVLLIYFRHSNLGACTSGALRSLMRLPNPLPIMLDTIKRRPCQEGMLNLRC